MRAGAAAKGRAQSRESFTNVMALRLGNAPGWDQQTLALNARYSDSTRSTGSVVRKLRK